MKSIAINGLGRIGKLMLRVLHEQNLLSNVVLVNDSIGTPEQHAHLLEFDTVHGRWPIDIGYNDDSLTIGKHNIRCSAHKDIEALPLQDADLVIDCTGAYRSPETLQPYFDNGAKKLLISCPVKHSNALNVVFGVNHKLYDAQHHSIITAASCTTNCIAPVIKVVHEAFGIVHGCITTLHDVTNTQTIVDRPAKDLRRARSALNSLIPTTTGSATAIALIYPELSGRLDGHAVRVPLLNASLTDCVFELEKETSVEEVNERLHVAANGELSGILGFETRPLVSADFVNDSRSGIVDALSTQVVDKTLLKLYVWYDNEWGYACRMGDIAGMILTE